MNARLRRWSIHTGALLIPALTAIAGCATRIPASPDRSRIVLPTPLRESDWPTRYPTTLAGAPGADGGSMSRVLSSPWNLAVVGDPDAGAHGWWQPTPLGQYGRGVVFGDGPDRGDEPIQGAETGGRNDRYWWLFATTSLTPMDLATARLGESEERAREGGRVRAVASVLWPPHGERRRGLVLFLPSLTSGFPERALRHRLQQAGWAVLEIVRPADGQAGGVRSYPGPSRPETVDVSFPNELIGAASAYDLWILPLYDYTLTIGYEENERREAEEQAVATVRFVADAFDSIMADWAYAAEGMIEFLEDRRPDIPTGPLVVIGCSLGGIAAPTVCARLGERVDAAVFIGGGANIARIFTTTVMPGMTAGRSWEALEALGRGRLDAIYLESTRLDPYHTSRHLLHVPVLMLHASFDAIVPAPTGRLLHERLGEPEMWEYPVGHLGLFLLLPTQVDAILTWMDRQTRSAGEDAGFH